MKVIIAGSRDYIQYSGVVKAMVDSGFQPTEIVSGHARGVDRLGEQWAKENGVPVKVFEADWGRLKLSAGPARNEQMAEYVGSGGALVALWDGMSSGTKDMINRAKKRGIKIHIYWVNL